MTTPTEFSSTDLRVLQRQLAEWRQAQSGRPRLPSDVWEAAAVLAHRHRPSPVARTLGLSYVKLVQWMSRTAPKIPAALELVPKAGKGGRDWVGMRGEGMEGGGDLELQRRIEGL